MSAELLWFRSDCSMKQFVPKVTVPSCCEWCCCFTSDLCTFPRIGTKQVSLMALGVGYLVELDSLAKRIDGG